jgi:hypothetical protein
VQGSLDDTSFRALWVAPSGHATAGMHVNDWGAIDEIRQLIETGSVVETNDARARP